MKDCKAAGWTRAPLTACLAVAMFGGVAIEVGAAGTGASQNASPLSDEDGESMDTHPLEPRYLSADAFSTNRSPLDSVDFVLSDDEPSGSRELRGAHGEARPDRLQPPKPSRQGPTGHARNDGAGKPLAQRGPRSANRLEALARPKPAYKLDKDGRVVVADKADASSTPDRGAARKTAKPYWREARFPMSLSYRQGYLRGELARDRAALEVAQERCMTYAERALPKAISKLTPGEARELYRDHFAKAGVVIQLPRVGQANGQAQAVNAQYAADAAADVSDATYSDASYSDATHSEANPAAVDLPDLGAREVLRVLLQCEDFVTVLGPDADARSKDALERLGALTEEETRHKTVGALWEEVSGNSFILTEVKGPRDFGQFENRLASRGVRSGAVASELYGEEPVVLHDLPQRDRLVAVVAHGEHWSHDRPRYIVAIFLRNGHFILPGWSVSGPTGKQIQQADAIQFEPDTHLGEIEYVIYRAQDDV